MKKQFTRWSQLVAVVAVGAAFAGDALAQTKRAPATAPRQGAPRQGTAAPSPHRGQIDKYLAEGVLLDNENEVELAKIAQTRAESKKVVSFSEQMVTDHEQFAKELENYAGPVAKGQVRGTADEAEGAGVRRETSVVENVPRPKNGTAQPAQSPAGGVRTQSSPQYDRLAEAFVQIHQEIAKECRESGQHELESKKGAEFDKCYIGMQLGAHMKMIDVLKVFERHASPELEKVFANGRKTAQKHLDRAKEIMKDLDDGKDSEAVSKK